MKIYEDGILNVRWTWEEAHPEGKRPHYDVPNDFVNTSKPAKQGDILGRHVRITRMPFSINFTQ